MYRFATAPRGVTRWWPWAVLYGLLFATSVGAAPAAQRAVIELLNRAAHEIERGELERADAALERALRLDSGDAAIWRSLAELRRLQGKTDQRDALLAKAQSLDGRAIRSPAEKAPPVAASREPVVASGADEAIDADSGSTLRRPAGEKTPNYASPAEPASISNGELARRLRERSARLRLANALAASRRPTSFDLDR